MIGPVTSGSAERSTTPEAGPSVGPQIPAGYAAKKPAEVEEEEEEDDYVPELPPDLVAQRATQKARVLGPSFPSAIQNSYDDSDDDDVGPVPLPAHLSFQHQEKSGVEEFLEREKRRKKAMEVCGIGPESIYRSLGLFYSRMQRNRRPPSATSGCWCLPRSQICSNVRPIGIMFSQFRVFMPVQIETAIDPTRMNKPRKFAPTTNPNAGSTDTTLWTETPAERQQRMADELAGKKRRKENSDIPDDHGRGVPESLKRQKIDNEIQKAVADHNVCGIAASPLFLAHIECRGKTGQSPCYRCMRRSMKLHSQSRRRTMPYGIIREIWHYLDVCWMINREVRSLRILLGSQTGLGPANSLERCNP